MNGRRIHYTADELLFVAARRDLPRREIHAAFVAAFGRTDVSVAHLKALCTRAGWTTARASFTSDEDRVMRVDFPHHPSAQIAVMLGRSVGSVVHRARTLGLTKSPEYLASAASGRLQPGASIGAATCFRKGHISATKGIKRPAGWSPGRMAETQFRKQQAPRNWRPLGSTRMIKGYQFTKVADERLVSWTKNWRQTHVLNWEAVHGPIPSGHALKSIDGDSTNTAASNWQLVPRAVLPRLAGGRHGRLGYNQAPDALKPVLLTTARLVHAAKQRQTRAAA
jgi:hypothetical protein